MANSGKVLALRQPQASAFAKVPDAAPPAYTTPAQPALRAVPNRVVIGTAGCGGGSNAHTEPCALFSEVSPSDRQAILSSARQKTYPARECIFVQGDAARHVYVVLEGYVKIHQVGSSGNEVILRLMSPGDLIKASTSGARGTHTSTAQAIQSCNILIWETATFEALLERHPSCDASRSKFTPTADGHGRRFQRCPQGVAHRLSRQIVACFRRSASRLMAT
jgi:CRP-like cAMP-binding protein